MYIAVQAGTTGEFHTTFNESYGAQTADGNVMWQNIGTVHVPIGGWPGMTPANTYFPSDRGRQSVQHMFCRARAKLRKRARALEVNFDTRFEVAAQLSCRMNGAVHDVRLPGGGVSGKVMSYKLKVNGDSGTVGGSVMLGCSVGKEPLTGHPWTVPTNDGVPCYAAPGYMQRGYQQYIDTTGHPIIAGVTFGSPPTPPGWPALPPTLPPVGCPPLASFWSTGLVDAGGNEMGYTPPVSDPNDDGLVFPASPSDLIMRQSWHGITSTMNPGNIAIYNLQLQQVIHNALEEAKKKQGLSTPNPDVTIDTVNMYDLEIAVQTAVFRSMMQGTGLWYELVLKPLTNGPFDNYYVVSTTPLLMPQTVNLAALTTE